MPALTVIIDDQTHGLLLGFAAETGRTVEYLAEAAIANATLSAAVSVLSANGWPGAKPEDAA